MSLIRVYSKKRKGDFFMVLTGALIALLIMFSAR